MKSALACHWQQTVYATFPYLHASCVPRAKPECVIAAASLTAVSVKTECSQPCPIHLCHQSQPVHTCIVNKYQCRT